VYSGCVNDDLNKKNVKVNPLRYHHYPFGDGKWLPGESGFVGKLFFFFFDNCLIGGL
jgi:hypothetical protein